MYRKKPYRLCDRNYGKPGCPGWPSVEEAKVKITKWLTENHRGRAKVNFKLRETGYSPVRDTGGEPIPIVYCEKCGYVPLPESELPLTPAGSRFL